MDLLKKFVGKIPTGTVWPFTFFVLFGSVWQSRQSSFLNFAAAFGSAAPEVRLHENKSKSADSTVGNNGEGDDGVRLVCAVGIHSASQPSHAIASSALRSEEHTSELQ